MIAPLLKISPAIYCSRIVLSSTGIILRLIKLYKFPFCSRASFCNSFALLCLTIILTAPYPLSYIDCSTSYIVSAFSSSTIEHEKNEDLYGVQLLGESNQLQEYKLRKRIIKFLKTIKKLKSKYLQKLELILILKIKVLKVKIIEFIRLKI